MSKEQSMEINPGIILHKKQVQEEERLLYLFEIEVKKMKAVEFIADFNGSENIQVEGRNNLVTVTNIDPFNKKPIATLILMDGWKLKSKFKFTLKTPSINIQEKHLGPKFEELQQEIERAQQVLAISALPSKSIAEANQVLVANNARFIDLGFLPTDNSVFSSMVDTSTFDTLIHWRRPHQFREIDANRGIKEVTVFYDSIDPSDIKPGCLGDGWVLSALASLAERPSLIERLFVTKEVQQNGLYRVKLCKNGEWQTVTIDDLFPCFPLGAPLFSKAHGNELWVMILEKAYAKLHGNYFSLRGGYAHEALQDFTGCPTQSLTFEDDDVQSSIQTGTFWDELRDFQNQGYVLSLSTPGEDRWVDHTTPEDSDGQGLLPGHAYTVLQVREAKGFQLLNIRNPWGNFQWSGDWGKESNLWTDEMRQLVNPELKEDDGSFWMSFDDAQKNFYCLNVCKVKNWDEVRIKGKFIKIEEIDDPSIEQVVSKWFYSVDVQERTSLIISLHQEDERVEGVAMQRPYLDVSLAVFKKLSGENQELVQCTEFNFERQVELEVHLDPGSYIIVPRTTGCSMRKTSNVDHEATPLLEKFGYLTAEAKSCLKDIFRKFDMLLNRVLSYAEFKAFYECLDKKITEKQFKEDLLNNFDSTEQGLTLTGFLQFWEAKIKTLGEDGIFEWLESLGYDKTLHSLRSRVFLLNIHSTSQLAVTVRDAVQVDMDSRSNAKIIEERGKAMETKSSNQGVRALYHMSKGVHAYSYGVINDQEVPVEVTLNCSGSKNMAFSVKSSVVKKRVEPGHTMFMLHAEALKTVENFTRSAVCTWINLKDQIIKLTTPQMEADSPSVFIWTDTATVKALATEKAPLSNPLPGHSYPDKLDFFEVSADGSYTGAITKDGRVLLWDAGSGQQLFESAFSGEISNLYFSPASQFLVVVHYKDKKNTSLMVDCRKRTVSQFEHPFTKPDKVFVAFLDEDRHLVSQTQPNEVEVFETSSMSKISKMDIFPAQQIISVPNCKQPLFFVVNQSAQQDGKKGCMLCVYDALAQEQCIKEFFEEMDEVVLFPSPVGDRVLVRYGKHVDTSGLNYYGSNALAMIRFDTKRRRNLMVYVGRIHCIAWRGDGEMFAVSSGTMPAHLVLYNHKGDPTYLVGKYARNYFNFSPNGVLMAACGFSDLGGKIDIWDINRFKVVGQMTHATAGKVQWAPDGFHLLSENNFSNLKESNSYRVFMADGTQKVAVDMKGRLYGAKWLPKGTLRKNVTLAEVVEKKASKKIGFIRDNDGEDFFANLRRTKNETSVQDEAGPVTQKIIRQFNEEFLKSRGLEVPQRKPVPKKKPDGASGAGEKKKKKKKKRKKKAADPFAD